MGSFFHDRAEAGRRLAAVLAPLPHGQAVVVGLARGGVVVAAEVARCLQLPLDALAVRKIGYPRQPEYGIGAVTPGGGIYLRTAEDLGEAELQLAIRHAQEDSEALDRILHAGRSPADLDGATAVLVDDGLATGATMIAAVRWARARAAARVVVAVPVAAAGTAMLVRDEADSVICLQELRRFGSVGSWYERFTQVGDAEVVALLARAVTPEDA